MRTPLFICHMRYGTITAYQKEGETIHHGSPRKAMRKSKQEVHSNLFICWRISIAISKYCKIFMVSQASAKMRRSVLCAEDKRTEYLASAPQQNYSPYYYSSKSHQ